MGKIGPLELVLIFAVILLVFGPSKLPQIHCEFHVRQTDY